MDVCGQIMLAIAFGLAGMGAFSPFPFKLLLHANTFSLLGKPAAVNDLGQVITNSTIVDTALASASSALVGYR